MSEPMIPRNYQEWEGALPAFIKQSPIWRLHVYRAALFAFDLAKYDIRRLRRSIESRALIPQLYRAVGSIGANLVEGSSRQSGNDRKRFFEYALGSAREADHWYHGCDWVLGETITSHRRQHLQGICAQIVVLIPKQFNLRENNQEYGDDDLGE